MRTICSREIFTKKCRQQQNFDSDPKEAWHYNHVTFTPIAKNFMLYCRLIYMLSMLYVRLTIKVKVGIPESFKGGWYLHKITGSSHRNLGYHNVSSFISHYSPHRIAHLQLKVAGPLADILSKRILDTIGAQPLTDTWKISTRFINQRLA